MSGGYVEFVTTQADAELIEAAAQIFNAFDGQERALAIRVKQAVIDNRQVDGLKTVFFGFMEGEQLPDPMSWEDCRLAVASIKNYLSTRPANGAPRR